MIDETNSPGKRNKPGRTAYAPTDADRTTVSTAAALGHTHDEIAAALGCSVPTLRKYYAAELATRMPAENLFNAAPDSTSPPPQPTPPRSRPPRSSGGGRPKRRPTDAERRRVSELVAVGFKAPRLAAVLDASEPWVRKHFAAELNTAADIKRAEVIAMMFRSAHKGSVPAQRALLDAMDKKLLDDIAEKFTGQDAPAKTAPLGKKEIAETASDAVITDSPWSEFLAPATPH